MSVKYEIELSTGKKVVLDEFKIKTKNLAAKNVSAKGATGTEAEALAQDEVFRLLIVSVNGKVPSAVEREDLDNLFTYSEYNESLMAIQDIMGSGSKKPKIKVLTDSGGE